MAKEKKDFDLVAVDIGYGYVKAISKNTNKRVIFYAGSGKAVKNKTEGLDMYNSNPNDIDNIHVKINGVEQFIGELALEKSPKVDPALNQDRFSSDIALNLLNVAIQLVSDEDEVYLVTGLPYDFYSNQKDTLKDSVLGTLPLVEWEAGSKKGLRRQIKVKKVMVLPQAMSAAFSVLFNSDGSYSRPDLMQPFNTIGLIDIGHMTTDYVFMHIGEEGELLPVDEKSNTISDSGGNSLYKAIEGHYKQEGDGQEMSERDMKKILRNHKIKHAKQGLIDFSGVIPEEIERVSNHIYGKIESAWENELNTLDEIFFVGGGTHIYGDELQKRFDNRLKTVTESQFANVEGYLWYGKSILEENDNESQNENQESVN